jgi:hypothetical protein
MPKQSDYERIRRLVIDQIASVWGTKLPDPMVEAFIEDLADYDDTTLVAAMREVRRTCKLPPRIAHLVEACRSVGGERAGQSGDAAAAFSAALRQRDGDAERMAKAFVGQFAFVDLAGEARIGGWERPLLAYAYEAALLQARYLTRACNPGYGQLVLTGGKQLETHEIEARIREFVTFCMRQASTGTIEVAPPAYLLAEWKADASLGEAA